MSSFNLIIDEGDRSVSCDVQQYVKYGNDSQHGLSWFYAKYTHTQLGHTFVMNIWSVDPNKGKSTLTRPNDVITCQFQISYLICLLVLCCYRRIGSPKYSLSNLKLITSLSPLKTVWRSIQLKHGLNYTIWLCNKYMFILSCMFWMTLLSYIGSCSIQSGKFSSSYDI